ncbi:MAG: hypothetical protein ABJ275_03875 [Maricaulaceae bacterium]
MAESNARFQAISALTGTGFTTTEAEMIANFPIRRKIVTWLMILGNLGIVSVLSTLMISFVRTDANVGAVLVQLAWMIGVIVVFFGIMLTPIVDRFFCGVIGFLLKKLTFLGGRHYQKLLQLGNEFSVSEHQFLAKESLTPEKIQGQLEDFTILAVRRSSGVTEQFVLGMAPIKPDDSLILFGPDRGHDSLKAL